MSDFDFFDVAPEEQSSYIKVIGVGGAGTNAVNHMYRQGITGVDFIVCNTDKQSLDASPVTTKIKLGDKDLGAGNDPAVGQKAAIAASDRIKTVLSNNTHMLFIAAGMGGGTGTGASPEIAKIAKEIEVDDGNDEILVVAVVTIPFSFEGKKRREQATMGIENLRKVVDSIIIVNTDKLKGRGTMLMSNAFALADDVLLTAAKGISEIMTANAYIHVDFRDVQSVMQHSGVALMGSGIGEGEDRAYEAIKAATTSDLLNDNDLKQTKNILLYVSFSSDEKFQLQMDELETITNYIEELTSPDVDKIWGYGYDDSLEGKIAITLVATGFESKTIYNPIPRKPGISIPENPKPAHRENPKPIPTIENPLDRIEDKIKDTANGFGIKTQPNQEPSTTSVLDKPKEIETKRITLGDPISFQPPVQQKESEHIKTNDEIIKEFERTEGKTQSIEIPEDIQTPTRLSMSSLFAPSENKEMEQIFSRRESSDPTTISKPSLKEITQDNTVTTFEKSNSVYENSSDAKRERIKKIHDLLNSGNREIIMNLRPAVDNIDEKLSNLKIPDTGMRISKDGSISIMENPIISSGVD
ncbi:MAG: cell division protein FtsZ [Bacteroidales bacterium]|nr:cell division protein FtsZ [Bacteroidales bacterium]